MQSATEVGDVDKICDCVIEGIKMREELAKNPDLEMLEELKKILLRGDTLIFQAMRMLELNQPQRALFYLQTLVNFIGEETTKRFSILFFLAARAHYMLGNFPMAVKFFSDYDELRFKDWHDFDELSLFYRGNCMAMLQRPAEAMILYSTALQISPNFPEARNNFAIIQSGKGGELVGELSSLWNPCAWQDFPIFINARDRLGVMKKLIDWLLDAGYRNLIILDNDSTYPPLLTYYSELEKDSRVKIVRLGKNLGHKALWKSGVLEDLKISTPYVYTDPDVVPDKNCPKDFVGKLFEVLQSHHEIRKVAPALVWEDITFFDKEKWQKYEKDLCERAYIGGNLCFSNVDTTFALYSNIRNYSLRSSIRTLGDMRIRHLPWYFDYDNLPEDEKYYMEHAEKNFITTVKK